MIKEEMVFEILSRVTASFGANLRSLVLSDETSKLELVPSCSCCDSHRLDSIYSIVIPCGCRRLPIISRFPLPRQKHLHSDRESPNPLRRAHLLLPNPRFPLFLY